MASEQSNLFAAFVCNPRQTAQAASPKHASGLGARATRSTTTKLSAQPQLTPHPGHTPMPTTHNPHNQNPHHQAEGTTVTLPLSPSTQLQQSGSISLSLPATPNHLPSATPASLPTAAPSPSAGSHPATRTPTPSRKRKAPGTGQPQRVTDGRAVTDGPGVPEKLGPGQPLRLIIIGHNPSEASWRAGHVYAHPANWMWRILIKTGIAPPGTRGAEDDDKLPEACGVGFTDLGTGHPGTDSSSFSSQVLMTWRDEFYSRLRRHLQATASVLGCSCGVCGAPSIVAFSGKRMFVELLNAGLKGKARTKTVEYGMQSLRPPGWPLPPSTEVWVCTSTSGAAPMRNEEREAPYAALAERLGQVPWPRRAVVGCGPGGGVAVKGEGGGSNMGGKGGKQ